MDLSIQTLSSVNEVDNVVLGSGLAAAIIYSLVGLSLFLVSIKLLSRSLKNLSGRKMRKLLLSLSDRPFLALGAGVLFTTIIQSSDGSVAIIIGLLAAGFISLKGAIAFILGANIGTATTSILVAFQSSFKFSLYFNILLIIGALGFLIFNKRRRIEVSFIIFTLGGIFVGLAVLGAAVKEITKLDAFENFFKSISTNIWASLSLSIVFTGLFQSSSATVTIYQTLYVASVNSGGTLLPLSTAIALIFGANIGTTFTSVVVATLSKSKDAGRVAIVWLTTNLVITLIFTPLIQGVYAPFISVLVPSSENAAFQLSLAHLLFNAILTILFSIFIPELEKLCYLILPIKATEKESAIHLPNDLASVALALEIARKNTAKMGDFTLRMLYQFNLYVENSKSFKESEIAKLRDVVKDFRKQLYRFSIGISRQDLTKSSSSKNLSLILAQRNFDSMSNLIIELFDHYNISRKFYKREVPEYYDKWNQEISQNVEVTMQLLALAVVYILNPSQEKYLDIKATYTRSLEVNETLINHFYRDSLTISSKTEAQYETEYISIIKTLERINQNSFQIATYIGKKTHEKVNLAELANQNRDDTELLSLHL